ncbi:MAG TPA: ABC transporter transmembrane domain-containing protein, partial [Methylomirabilota bacterium]|nr:ABC transporter transmembrane domain-containing protein [Methylomirabilota bacterium]
MPDVPVADEHDDVVGRAFDRRLAGRLWATARAHHRLIAAAVVLFPLISLLELAQPYLLKVAIDDHILHADWRGLTTIAVVYAVALAGLYGLRLLEAFLMALTGQRVIHDLRAALFTHLLGLEAGFFDRTPVGRLMTRVLNDVEAVSEAFTSGLFAVVADVVTLAGVVAIMLWMDWRLALVTFAIVPVLFGVAGYFRIRARDAYREVRRRLARLNAFLQESIQGMAVVQLFAREAHERREFQRLNEAYRSGLFASTRFEAALYAAVEALGSVALALLLWYGGGRILDGALTFGALVAFIQYTSRFFLPIRDLGAKYTVMQAAMASAERIFGLLDRAPAIVSPPRGAAPAARAGRVDFEHVWFAYEDERWVLADCAFTVAPGEHVALVGTTGEGKSTCVRLLNRTWDVGRGRVLVDGVDVRAWDLARLRRHVGVIFQDPVLFTGTVEANLALDVNGAGPAAVERALQSANAEALIARLPAGLQTALVERAANLSHGERQLLA